ncbi:Glycosyltransferase [Gammaproteobacteria bacterium]
MKPVITIAVPSLNQGVFLEACLDSLFAQNLPLEVFVADAGSTDGTLSIIKRWAPRLSGWRTGSDAGQSAAINECIARGNAPYVAWLNSDDAYLPGGLQILLDMLEIHDQWPAAYGRAWHTDVALKKTSRVWTRPFDEWWFANGCFISQPATLIRRMAWETIGGLDESLHMAMDYDLWWRLYRRFGPPGYVSHDVALNRNHDRTKTLTRRRDHYWEAMAVVRRHYGRVPIKWWLAWPIAVWGRTWWGSRRSRKHR